ncbi:MAG: hydrogenase expression/formation protein HypE [Nostocoides sp.]
MSAHTENNPRSAPTSMEAQLDRIERIRKRRPRLLDDVVTLAHGAGGKSSAALIDAVFLEAFRDPGLHQLGDGALLPPSGSDGLAFSTDSYVVQPLRFPGGSIGDLAVHGTVNDLAMCGARPQWLSAGFVIEEGFPIEDLRGIVNDMAAAAERSGVAIVTGDTKVVPKGAADGLYINTAGVGVIPQGRALGADKVQPGDRVIVSGPIAAHGMAIMIARGDLALEADIVSDTAPLAGLVDALLTAVPNTRWLRDATRGGLGTVANELAQDTDLGIVLDETCLPVDETVAAACDILGIDPIHVANEGRFVAVVPAEDAEDAVVALRSLPGGHEAVVIGEVVEDLAGLVALRTLYGGTRIVDMLVGDPLPRIC